MLIYTPPSVEYTPVSYNSRFHQAITHPVRCTRQLAGVFGFETTKDLWKLYVHDPSTTPIFNDWATERETLVSKNFKGIFQARMMNLAGDPRFHPTLHNTDRGAIECLGILEYDSFDDVYKAPLICLWYIVRLVKAKPALFPRSEATPATPLKLNKYDVFHAYRLLRWAWANDATGKTKQEMLRNCQFKAADHPDPAIEESPAVTDDNAEDKANMDPEETGQDSFSWEDWLVDP